MNSRPGWSGSSAATERGGDQEEVARLRRVLSERNDEVAALTARVTELAETASRETTRAREFAKRTKELADLLDEAEAACARLEASLCRADLRCAENELRLATDVSRADTGSKLAESASERYREVVERWRDTEKRLVRAQQERTLAKQHQVELQMALNKAVQEREQLSKHNQKLQARLNVALLDKDDAVAASSQRLIQVEQRVRFAFDELECLGDDTHHLLRLASEGMWSALKDDVPRTMRTTKSNVVQEWISTRFGECATTQDVVVTASCLLSRLRLARLEIVEQVPLRLEVVPLGEGRSGSDATVRFAVGLLTRAIQWRLGVDLVAAISDAGDDVYRVSLNVEGRPAASPL